MNIEQIKNALLSRKKLSFAIEGKSTNLIIRASNNSNGIKEIDTIFFRLDKYQQYSAPLRSDTISYLNKANKSISELLQLGGFNIPISDIDKVCLILSEMKERECQSW